MSKTAKIIQLRKILKDSIARGLHQKLWVRLHILRSIIFVEWNFKWTFFCHFSATTIILSALVISQISLSNISLISGRNKLLPDPSLLFSPSSGQTKGGLGEDHRYWTKLCQRGKISSYEQGRSHYLVILSLWLSCICLKKWESNLLRQKKEYCNQYSKVPQHHFIAHYKPCLEI